MKTAKRKIIIIVQKSSNRVRIRFGFIDDETEYETEFSHSTADYNRGLTISSIF